MSRTAICTIASLSLYLGFGDHSLATNYVAGQSFRVECESELEMETVAFEILRNGEPIDAMGDPGGSSESRMVVTIDQILEADSGTPTKLRRVFETVEGSSSSERRGEQQYDCPLDGLTLELQLEEGEVNVEVVEGEEPDEEQALEGHRLGFAADALLPGEAVAVDQSWELNDRQVRRVLGLGVDRALFQRSGGGGEGRGEGGGGRGRRGGGGRGGNAFALMRSAEWNATATLAAVEEEHEGENCVRIEFLFEAEGDMPEPESGRGRGRMLEFERVPFNESTYELSVEGFLIFSVDSSLPLHLELEGELGTESNILRENGEMSIEIHSEEAGTFLYKLKVSPEDEG